MEKEFIDILKKLVDEQGKKSLIDNARFKGLLADYTGTSHKNESRLLVQAVAAGAANAIFSADDLAPCKKTQIRMLHEEHFISVDMACDVVDALALVLRADNSKSEYPVTPAASPVSQTASAVGGPAVSFAPPRQTEDAETLFDRGCKEYERNDNAEAFRCYSKAADQGYAEAQNNLGWCYDNGQGVPKDNAKAAE